MIKYYSAEEMKTLYWEEISKNEAVSQLILGNIKTVCKAREKGDDVPEDTRFGVILKEQEPVYYFCNYLPYAMVVVAADPIAPYPDEECGRELAESFHENGIYYTGIQANEKFAKAFVKSSNHRYREELSMAIMVARKVNHYPLRGEVIRATATDVEVVTDMYRGFVKDALHEEISYEDAYSKMKTRLENPEMDIWLYRVDGEIIGMHGSTRKLERGISLTLVYVYPKMRGRGYCKEMVAWSTEHYFEQGCEYVSLYVDRNNPISNAAYQAVGYEYISKVVSYTIVLL